MGITSSLVGNSIVGETEWHQLCALAHLRFSPMANGLVKLTHGDDDDSENLFQTFKNPFPHSLSSSSRSHLIECLSTELELIGMTGGKEIVCNSNGKRKFLGNDECFCNHQNQFLLK